MYIIIYVTLCKCVSACAQAHCKNLQIETVANVFHQRLHLVIPKWFIAIPVVFGLFTAVFSRWLADAAGKLQNYEIRFCTVVPPMFVLQCYHPSSWHCTLHIILAPDWKRFISMILSLFTYHHYCMHGVVWFGLSFTVVSIVFLILELLQNIGDIVAIKIQFLRVCSQY